MDETAINRVWSCWRGVLLLLGVAAMLSVPAAQRLPSVGCDTRLLLQTPSPFTSDKPFTPATKDNGTRSPRALVTRLTNGPLTMAVAWDAHAAGTDPDCLRVDVTGSGQFAHAPAIPLPAPTTKTGHAYRSLGPSEITFTINNQPVTTIARGECQFSDGVPRHVTLSLGTALLGTCQLAGKSYAVRVADGNGNLSCGDPYVLGKKDGHNDIAARGDTLLLAPAKSPLKTNVIKAYYGHPILVNKHWYQILLAADRAAFTVTELGNNTLGTLTAMESPWSAELIGSRYLLHFTGAPRTLTAPTDKYVVTSLAMRTPAGLYATSGFLHGDGTLEAIGLNPLLLTVAAKRKASLIISVTPLIRVTPNIDEVEFTPDDVLDPSGEAMVHADLGSWDFAVFDAKGKQVFSEKLVPG